MERKISGCQVNHLKNPLGYRMEKTVFSWIENLEQVKTRRILVWGEESREVIGDTGFKQLDPLAEKLTLPLKPRSLNNFPAQLSGGEQQRVSIARALAKNPKLLLCDEPTGALDYQTGKAILKLLQDMCRERGMTVIVITHNSALTPMADRVIRIKNGKVSEMYRNEHPVSVETIEW